MKSIESSSAASIIRETDLSKIFWTLMWQPCLARAIRNLFSTDYEEIKAVDKISFDIAPGEPGKQGVVQ